VRNTLSLCQRKKGNARKLRSPFSALSLQRSSEMLIFVIEIDRLAQEVGLEMSRS
jgi:hypothetical protein